MSVPILKIRDKDGNVSSIPAIKGTPGKSAYEYAKDAGYTGTEEEFAEQLVNGGSGGGGTGGIPHIELTMAEYYELILSGTVEEDVVYFITDAEGGSDEPEKEIVYVGSNSNLLVNSDFGNPVNQRGQTQYEIADSWQSIHTVDRWLLSGQLANLVVGDGFVKVTTTTHESYFRQLYEHNLSGTYTVTVKVKSLIGNVVCYMNNSDGSTFGSTLLKVGINTIQINGDSMRQLMFDIHQNATIEIEYVKLEQGAIATPFIPRLYAEELILCQRYYYKAKSTGWTYVSNGCFGLDKNFFCNFSLPCEMRVKPTLTYGDVYIDRLTEGPIKTTINSMSVLSNFGANVVLTANVVSSVENLSGYTGTLVFGSENSYLAFDAEI